MRLIVLSLAAALLSACAAYKHLMADPPHSDYFVVFFAAETATPLPEGRAALSRAAADAEHGTPRTVTVKYYVSRNDTSKGLAEERVAAVTRVLIEGGFAKEMIRVVAQETDRQSFVRLGDGVVVQVERGPPAAEKDDSAD